MLILSVFIAWMNKAFMHLYPLGFLIIIHLVLYTIYKQKYVTLILDTFSIISAINGCKP